MTDLPGNYNPRSAPAWRPLAALVAGVVAAHMLVLQASPAQFGQRGSNDASEIAAKTFETRSIEVPATLPAAAPAPAPPALASVAPVVRPTPKVKQNRPADQQIRAQAAPKSIAKTIPDTPAMAVPAAPALDQLPETTTAAASPTSAQPQATLAAAQQQATLTPADMSPALAAAASNAMPADPASYLATPVTAINLPGSARLQYKVVGLSKSLRYQATAELLWKANGDRYEAALKVSAFLVGSRSMTSVGQITAMGLAPTRFADKSKNELAAHFEPAKGKIVFSANTPDAAWVQGAQDRVSVFLQLGGILAARPADFPAGASVTIFTVGPRDAEPWTFMVESTESQEVLGAPMETLKLTRKPRREFDQKVEVWYAPSLGYLPVRNRITQPSGDFVDQQLSEVSRS